MNSIYKSLMLPATLLACMSPMLTSCDDVKEDDRYIIVERPSIARKVLIQEFTGINCVNCPTGAATVHSIQELYPESVIVVGMHPGGTGFSGPIGPFNLNSELARVYFDYYEPAGFPAAVIDGQSPETNIALWSGMVTSQLSEEAVGDIVLNPTFDPDTRNLTVDYEVAINEVYSHPLHINLWIVENGIVGPQKSGNRLIIDYVHNHVLRGSMTGDWGLKLGDSFLPENDLTGTVTLTLDPAWNEANCQIVAFIQNDDRRVFQAEEADVMSAAE